MKQLLSRLSAEGKGGGGGGIGGGGGSPVKVKNDVQFKKDEK